MALVSVNIYYDLSIMLILVKTCGNQLNILLIYMIPILLVNLILRPLIADPRPPQACIDGYGMPSLHSTSAGDIFMIMNHLQMVGRVKSFKWVLFYMIYSINQAYSRIYLNYESESQVLIGYIFGLILSYLLIL